MGTSEDEARQEFALDMRKAHDLFWSSQRPGPGQPGDQFKEVEGMGETIDTDIVWFDKSIPDKPGRVYDASWAGVMCRLFVNPDGAVLVRFEGPWKEHEAKMFAEASLRARMERLAKEA